MLLPVHRSQYHLRRYSITLRDLLLHFDLDVIEITEPLRETFMVKPEAASPSFSGAGSA